jgi:hypothetical protein
VYYYRCIKHLLNEMSLASTGFKPMYKCDNLLKVVRDAHETFPEIGHQHRQGFAMLLQPTLGTFNTSLKDWQRKAGIKCDNWGTYNGNSDYTFLKRKGVHKRISNATENWSRTLLDILTDELDPLWNAICGKGCSAFSTDLIQAFREHMVDMERKLRFNLDQTQIKSFQEFFENMQLQIKEL